MVSMSGIPDVSIGLDDSEYIIETEEITVGSWKREGGRSADGNRVGSGYGQYAGVITSRTRSSRLIQGFGRKTRLGNSGSAGDVVCRIRHGNINAFYDSFRG